MSFNLDDFFQDNPILLRDGNGAVYPLAKDYSDGIRDPLWLDLPPLRCLSLTLQSLMNVGSNQKNRAAIIVLAIEVGQLIKARIIVS